MTFQLAPSGRFKRDLKRAVKRGKDVSKLSAVTDLLLAGEPLPAPYGDHPLKGNWKGWRDLHLYHPSEMLTRFRRVTPHERRRAFALASGQDLCPLVLDLTGFWFTASKTNALSLPRPAPIRTCSTISGRITMRRSS